MPSAKDTPLCYKNVARLPDGGQARTVPPTERLPPALSKHISFALDQIKLLEFLYFTVHCFKQYVYHILGQQSLIPPVLNQKYLQDA